MGTRRRPSIRDQPFFLSKMAESPPRYFRSKSPVRSPRSTGEILSQGPINENVLRILLDRGDLLTAQRLAATSRGIRSTGRPMLIEAERRAQAEHLIAVLELLDDVGPAIHPFSGETIYGMPSSSHLKALGLVQHAAAAGLVTIKKSVVMPAIVSDGFVEKLPNQRLMFRKIILAWTDDAGLGAPESHISAKRKGAPIVVRDVTDSLSAMSRFLRKLYPRFETPNTSMFRVGNIKGATLILKVTLAWE